jgi:type-F conjugative transfer system pilin assembly protein TrbC
MSAAVQASDPHQEALEIFQRSEQLKTLYQKKAFELLHQYEDLKKPYQNEVEQIRDKIHQTIKNNFKKEAQKENITINTDVGSTDSNTSENFLVFVSLSIPKQSLKALYQEARKKNVPLILRGLKNNSFKETALLLRNLEIELQINPELFRKYQVTRVPSFVLVKEQQFHTLSGNISLGYAKYKLMGLQ